MSGNVANAARLVTVTTTGLQCLRAVDGAGAGRVAGEPYPFVIKRNGGQLPVTLQSVDVE